MKTPVKTPVKTPCKNSVVRNVEIPFPSTLFDQVSVHLDGHLPVLPPGDVLDGHLPALPPGNVHDGHLPVLHSGDVHDGHLPVLPPGDVDDNPVQNTESILNPLIKTWLDSDTELSITKFYPGVEIIVQVVAVRGVFKFKKC